MKDGFSDAMEFDEDAETYNNFYSMYSLDTYTNIERMWIVVYYSFTTLSTVGFGDYNPKSNFERLIMIVVFVVGVALFSIIQGNFLTTIQNYQQIQAENENSERLSQFLSLLKKYNKGALNPVFKEKIEEHFRY